jgi:hypothetical protein
LHREFVARLKEAASGVSDGLCSIALADGIDLYPEESRYRPYHRPTTGVGLSLVSPGRKPLNVYNINHNKLHERIAEAGGTNRIIRTTEPMWIYVRHSNSDSSVTHNKPESLRPIDSIVERTIALCGLPREWLEDLSHLHDGANDPRPSIVGEKRLKRLLIKMELLNYTRELRAQGEHNSPRFHAVVSAIYAL